MRSVTSTKEHRLSLFLVEVRFWLPLAEGKGSQFSPRTVTPLGSPYHGLIGAATTAECAFFECGLYRSAFVLANRSNPGRIISVFYGDGVDRSQCAHVWDRMEGHVSE